MDDDLHDARSAPHDHPDGLASRDQADDRDGAFEGGRAFDDADAADDADDADEFADGDDERDTKAPPIQRFRGTGIGTVLGAALTGLGNVFEPSKKEEPAIIVEHDGGDPFADPIVLRLDPDDPRDSIVLVRRHLMPPRDTED